VYVYIDTAELRVHDSSSKYQLGVGVHSIMRVFFVKEKFPSFDIFQVNR